MCPLLLSDFGRLQDSEESEPTTLPIIGRIPAVRYDVRIAFHQPRLVRIFREQAVRPDVGEQYSWAQDAPVETNRGAGVHVLQKAYKRSKGHAGDSALPGISSRPCYEPPPGLSAGQSGREARPETR